MFCPNCGKKNEDRARFCEACGTRLEQPLQPQAPGHVPAPIPDQTLNHVPNLIPDQTLNQVPNQAGNPPCGGRAAGKPMPKRSLVIAVEIIALIALAVGFFQIGKSSFSARKIGEKFFISMANGDWDNAYRLLDLEESEFINEETFAALAPENSQIPVGNVAVCAVAEETGNFSENVLGTKTLGTEVTVNYRKKGSSSDSSVFLQLNRSAQKKLFFFENWKVSPQSLITNGFTVTVPAGAKVTFDGGTLDRHYITKEQGNENYESYQLPDIFNGSHEIAVSMEDRQEVKMTVDTDQGGFYLSSLPFQEEVLSGLIGNAGLMMQNIYAAAMEGKEFSEISEFFTTDSEALKQIKRDYKSLADALKETAYENQYQYAFRNIQGEAYGDTYDGEQAVAVDLEYDYTVEYAYGKDRAQKRAVNGSNSTMFRYTREGGNWVLCNLGCFSLR